MRSIKEQRADNTLSQEQSDLLDWAEKARPYILFALKYCKEYQDNGYTAYYAAEIRDAEKLLEELPE